MHELSIAENLVEIIKEEAALHNARSVKKVTLRIGRLAGVVPEALRFAFEVCTKGTIAENTVLDVMEIPLTGLCHKCNARFNLEDAVILCPYCNGIDVELLTGRELEIESMEIEDGS